MSDRPFMQLKTAELRDEVKGARGNVKILHQVYAETLFRSRKPARLLRELLVEEFAAMECPFPWPSTAVPAGGRRIRAIEFKQVEGILSVMGYRVGQAGVSVYKRRDLLDHIYESRLPKVHTTEYMAGWGSPKSATRLRKLAESIASFTRSAKRNNAARYATAISDWESDLKYLKKTYYHRYKFPWPRTSVEE